MSEIVLVHGAHVGPSCWDVVGSELRQLGHRVEAVDLHRGSLAADTEAVQAVVDGLGGPILACGWSYGGMVITGLELPPGSQLVYLCAFMPAQDETASSLVDSHPSGLGALMAFDDAGDLVLEGAAVDAFLWADLAPERAAAARASLRSQAIAPLVESPARTAWRSHASTYVVGRQDRVLHPDLQRQMATRAEHVLEWDTSHSPMLSRPDLVVDLLDRLAP